MFPKWYCGATQVLFGLQVHMAWMESGFNLHSTADMFPSSGQESSFLSKVYVLDVILNRFALYPICLDDDIVLVRLYHKNDLNNANDYKFCTMILFLPHCGVSILLCQGAKFMYF